MTLLQPVRTVSGPFVGREAEIARLSGAYQDAAAHGERLILVRGESGIGKTRLLSELKGRMRLQGAAVLEGHCTDGGRAFAPFAEILSAGLAFLDEVGARPDQELSPMLLSLGSRSAIAAGADAEPSEVRESAARLSDAELRIRFFDAFHAFLRTIAAVRAPLIVLHDLHRADPGSLDLLRYLVDGAGPFMEDVRPSISLRALFVVSMRSDIEGALPLADLHAHPKAQCIELTGLGPRGLRELFESPAVIERIMALTGGRPDDIEALLATPPGRTEDRLRRKLGTLADRSCKLLHALAVVNRPASPSVLARVAGVRATSAELGEILSCGLATKSVVDGEVQLAFARSSERDLVYAELDATVARRMHLAYGELLEEDEPIGIALQDLAFHYLRGASAERGVPVACDAADALCRAYAHDAAALLLEDALRIATSEQLPMIHERLVNAHRAAGDHARALIHAAKLREGRTDAVAERRMGELYTLTGEYDRAREALEAARGLALDAGDRRTLAEIEAELAEVWYQKGDYDKAFQVASRTLVMGQMEDLPSVSLYARNTLGKVHLSRGEFAAAAEVFGENVEAAQASGLELEELRATINLAIAHLRRQELPTAEELFSRASRIADSRGTLYYQAICRENLAVLAHTKGEYERALELYHDAVALLKKLGNKPLLGRVATNLGWLYLLFGDSQRARSLADLSVSMGDARASVRFKNLVLLADIELAQGRSDAAREALAAALELARQTSDETGMHDYALTAGRLALHDGDIAGARRILAQFGRVESPVKAAAFAVLRADVERAAGCDPYPASARAVELAERAGDADIEWRAQLRLSRALHDRGDERSSERQLRRAVQIDARLREQVPEAFRASYDCVEERIELRRQACGLDSVASLGSATPTPSAVWSAAPPRDAVQRNWGERYPDLVGTSRVMRSVCGIIDKVAPAESLVLIRGESGTGKELVAEAIHGGSSRRDRPLIKVNCAALVETLLLSELFGHERGAFTGALSRKKGRFELADGGTLFLDEIGDISPKTQVSLLRVLQEREFERVGGTTAVRVDVRILCATNRNLEQMVERGTFREDLYYRLKGLQIELPPLRQRPEDIQVLTEHFLTRIAAERGEATRVLAADAAELLSRYSWPGNVRELENTIRSVTLFAEGPVLTAAHFVEYGGVVARGSEPRGAEIRAVEPVANVEASAGVTPSGGVRHPADSNARNTSASSRPAFGRVLDGDVSLKDLKRDIEKECICRALKETRGNITKAAVLLGMKRPRLSQLVKQYGLAVAEGGN